MGAESLLQQLPWFILILLGLSYLIWSRFLNEGKLNIGWGKENAINYLLDILAIFVFIFSSLVGIVCFLSILSSIISLNFDINSITKVGEFIIMSLGLYLIIVFLLIYRKSKKNTQEFKQSLYRNLDRVILLESGVCVMFIFFWILVQFYSYRVFLFEPFMFSFLILIFVFLILILIRKFALTDGKTKLVMSKHKRDLFIFMAIIFITTLVIFLFSFPNIKYIGSQTEGYQIYDIATSPNFYNYSKTIIKIQDLCPKRSILSIIPLNFKKENLIFERKEEKENLKITYNGSLGERKILESYDKLEAKTFDLGDSPWIEDVKIKGEIVGLVYNENKIKREEVKEVYLYGLKRINISEEQFYYNDYDFRYKCEEYPCRKKIIFKNNLDLPVSIENYVIVKLNHRGVENISNCSFKRIFVETPIDAYNKRAECEDDGKGCSIEIYNFYKENHTIERFFDFSIYLNKKDGTITIHNTKINIPMDVNITVDFSC